MNTAFVAPTQAGTQRLLTVIPANAGANAELHAA
jgi:hypothetical protein